jgi:hypothetical protein
MKTNKVSLEVPVYSESLKFNWTDGFEITTGIENDEIRIVMNKAGLISLANHLLNLAQDEVPAGYHLHFDEHNSLTAGSTELIIEKANEAST